MSPISAGRGAAIVATAALVASCGSAPHGGTVSAALPPPPAGSSAERQAPAPLRGTTVVIDPGHQLGNARHPRQINKLVPAGGFRKPCNTTGTATNRGYPESTFAYRVARKLKRRLRARGARVLMTRTRNSRRLWGPCVDVRGRAGNRHTFGLRAPADVKISIHGDGARSSAHGFHAITPRKRAIRRSSHHLGRACRRALRHGGFRVANYVAGGDGLMYRNDLATLNLSRIPAVMVELGNMRNRHDARVMHAKRGKRRYARALGHAVENFLTR